jgi:hypothetical protein
MNFFITLTLILAASCSTVLAQHESALTSPARLNQLAQQKLKAHPHVPLADEKSEICAGTEVLEAGKVPNYGRARALRPPSEDEAIRGYQETYQRNCPQVRKEAGGRLK